MRSSVNWWLWRPRRAAPDGSSPKWLPKWLRSLSRDGFPVPELDGFVNFGASGGVYTASGVNDILTFTTSGLLFVNNPVGVEYLVVAGGGGGGADISGVAGSGGGGAGGLLTNLAASPLVLVRGTYTITVGAGGLGAVENGVTITAHATSGSASSIAALVSTVGGGRGSSNGGAPQAGGSGGGSRGGVVESGGTGTAPQGFAGTSRTLLAGGGGGGGAGSAGLVEDGDNGSGGGVGLSNSISGAAVFYAGGGSGAARNSTFLNPAGGVGGGGHGVGVNNPTGLLSDGTANRGGGGGGGHVGFRGGNAGSGIVVVRWVR